MICGEVVVHARWWQRLGDGDDGGSADGRSREVVVLGGLWHGCWCGGASVVRVKVAERQRRPRRKIFSGGRKNHGGAGNFEGDPTIVLALAQPKASPFEPALGVTLLGDSDHHSTLVSEFTRQNRNKSNTSSSKLEPGNDSQFDVKELSSTDVESRLTYQRVSEK
ncbi:hypothetical protein Tco_1146288 [Tanacetum coccineum]